MVSRVPTAFPNLGSGELAQSPDRGSCLSSCRAEGAKEESKCHPGYFGRKVGSAGTPDALEVQNESVVGTGPGCLPASENAGQGRTHVLVDVPKLRESVAPGARGVHHGEVSRPELTRLLDLPESVKQKMSLFKNDPPLVNIACVCDSTDKYHPRTWKPLYVIDDGRRCYHFYQVNSWIQPCLRDFPDLAYTTQEDSKQLDFLTVPVTAKSNKRPWPYIPEARSYFEDLAVLSSVSYTHLTLPTIYSV